MSPTRITKLMPEQEGLVPVYREKWRAIALSAEPIDRQKATYVIKAAYAAIDKKEPSILFFDSPFAAFNGVEYRYVSQLNHFQGRANCIDTPRRERTGILGSTSRLAR